MLNISLQSEYVLSVFGINITNSLFTSIIVTLILLVLAIFTNKSIKNGKKKLIAKALEVIVFQVIIFSDHVTLDRKITKKVFPLIATFFLLIAFSNLLALIPGFLGSFYLQNSSGQIPLFKSPNSDLTSTLALAIFSVSTIQYFSLSLLGPLEYIKRFINFSSLIGFVTGIFEFLSEIIKILSFSFRLFGNIFAGEILLLIMAYLVPYFLPLPFMLMEIFVGVIQAYIFAILTLTFIKTSSEKKIILQTTTK